jgi:hypothetical protein
MDNLISTCYVIYSLDFGVEPIIYLREPSLHPTNELAHEFDNPFSAKIFIQKELGSDITVHVTKERFSQLALVK